MITMLNTAWSRIVAAATVVAVLAAVTVLSGQDASADSPAQSAAEKKAQDIATIYCNIDGVVPAMTGIDDPAYLECVKQRAEEEMAKWESRH